MLLSYVIKYYIPIELISVTKVNKNFEEKIISENFDYDFRLEILTMSLGYILTIFSENRQHSYYSLNAIEL